MSADAAVYYNLSTYRPDAIDVAIPRKAKVSTLPDWPELNVCYFTDDRFDVGIETIEDGKTMQDKLVTFGLERTIYRLSISQYAERFTLKGDIFLYALFDGEYARATMDIDLLAQRIPNDAEEMKKVFDDIFSIECDDALRFDLNTLEVTNITEFKEYHGVNVSIMGYLDRTKVPVSIDIGFGDVIYPERMKREFPVFTIAFVDLLAKSCQSLLHFGKNNETYSSTFCLTRQDTCFLNKSLLIQCFSNTST